MSTFPGVPPYRPTNLDDWAQFSTITTNNCLNGKTNNTGIVTLSSSTASTTVTLALGRLGPDTAILLEPKTASAAASLSTTFVSTRNPSTGKFVLTHLSAGSGDRTFNFILVG